mgnify:CR=1 FL=1|tara:strand:- start:205074 stop:205640 length:567 start_codon:yes stop_codon:yes gene_type:complete
MLKNTKDSWGWGAQTLHWLVFVIFSALLYVGEEMSELDKTGTLFGMGKYQVYDYHKTFGFILLFIVFVRISWKFMNVSPQTSPATQLEKMGAHAVHYLLYAVMLIMPISGYVMSMAGGHGIKLFGNPEWLAPNILPLNKELAGIAHDVHEYTVYAIYVLLAVHILAAFYHHFCKKDNVLKAMLPWGRK